MLTCTMINNIHVIGFQDNISVQKDNSYKLKNKLKQLLVNSNYKLILDFQNIKFIDSSGICSLISCLKEALIHNGWIKIANVPSSIAVIFELIKLNKIFDIYDTVESALIK